MQHLVPPLINMASIGGITMCWLTSAGTMVLHHPFDPGIYLKQIKQAGVKVNVVG